MDCPRWMAIHLWAGRLAKDSGSLREHQRALCAPLSDEEQILLANLLLRIVQSQGLEANVHPGLPRIPQSSGGK